MAIAHDEGHDDKGPDLTYLDAHDEGHYGVVPDLTYLDTHDKGHDGEVPDVTYLDAHDQSHDGEGHSPATLAGHAGHQGSKHLVTGQVTGGRNQELGDEGNRSGGKGQDLLGVGFYRVSTS